MGESSESLGGVRYVGESVESGYLDARKSAEALLGLDEAIRYFVGTESTPLARLDYEIPVKVEKGSWQAQIPAWIAGGACVVVTAYLTAGAQQMAKNDFSEASLRAVFRHALEGIQWAIRIGKHLGTLAVRKFEGAKFRDGNREVGIPNAQGELLWVPLAFINAFEKMPAGLLSRLASVVTEGRALEVVVREGSVEVTETLAIQHKFVFCHEDSSVVLPELVHGDPFEGEGIVTRGNGNTNTLGFLYQGHILTCHPKDGKIIRFKQALFLRCRMTGVVSRTDKFGETTEAKPHIIFSDVVSLETDDSGTAQEPLFLDDDA